MTGHGWRAGCRRTRLPTRGAGRSAGCEMAIGPRVSGGSRTRRHESGTGPVRGPSLPRKPEQTGLARVAALVQHVDGSVDGEEPAREGVVQHLGEGVAALPFDVVARD